MIITNEKALQLAEKYGTPLYIYDETILRARCRELADMLPSKKLCGELFCQSQHKLGAFEDCSGRGFAGRCDVTGRDLY